MLHPHPVKMQFSLHRHTNVYASVAIPPSGPVQAAPLTQLKSEVRPEAVGMEVNTLLFMPHCLMFHFDESEGTAYLVNTWVVKIAEF